MICIALFQALNEVSRKEVLKELRNHNGKLFLCPPQKLAKIRIQHDVFQTKFTL